MAGTNTCRLCRTPCSECIRLCDAGGKTNEIYSITVKFFHPMFLEIDKETTKVIGVLCMQCWHHISGFNNFQQTVLLLHANLHTVAESAISRGQIQPTGGTSKDGGEQLDITADSELKIKDVSDTIVIPDDDAEVEDRKEVPTTSSCGQLTVTDHTVEFQLNSNATTRAQPEIILPSTYDERMPPFQIGNAMHIDEEFSDQEGDIFIVDELNDDIEVSSSSNDDLLEMSSAQYSSNAASEMIYPASRKNRKSPKEIDEIIAKWRPLLKCEGCPESFPTFTQLKTHFLAQHPNQEFYMLCCGRKLKYRFRVEEHAIIHMNPKAFKCQLCGKCFTTRFTLIAHIGQLHPGAKLGPSDNDDSPFKCSQCGFNCGDEATLLEHSSLHTDEQTFHCQFCNKSFKRQTALFKHSRLYHSDKDNGSNPPLYFKQCKLCPKAFTYRTGLYHHVRKYHPVAFENRRKRRVPNRDTP
ncbi:zinc finger protein 652-B-like [Musca domestica]|uniref:Zinc finger protein 652-B-like n=1 Tax=Musca domestica TaxID=7370 RepID=A0A9J7D8A7_MUSDO|nr:zinc finger protein 652-B-like [Musca domestica]XP_058975204.1 zinc finger protein 652-B-like [Musca domestica]